MYLICFSSTEVELLKRNKLFIHSFIQQTLALKKIAMNMIQGSKIYLSTSSLIWPSYQTGATTF